MIVLDTNVVSELMKPRPNATVRAWVNAHEGREFALTVTTTAELLVGVALLPDGKRKWRLAEDVRAVIDDDFANRVLTFDVSCARHFADIAATRTRAGRPITTFDAAIAATCRAQGAALATRNTDDFAGTGVELIDPWTAT